MHYATDTHWLTSFVLASTVERSGRATEFYRAARAGRYVRLAHGVHLPVDLWNGLDIDQKFLAQIHASARVSRTGIVFSHMAAAALWGLPVVGTWPALPEVAVPNATGGRSRRAFTGRRSSMMGEPDVVDGLSVTPLPTTLLDVAHSKQLPTAVAMLDFALRAPVLGETGLSAVRVTGGELVREFEAAPRAVGRSRCARALDLADGSSGSPGESLSRTGIHLLGLPRPLLQQAFFDSRGLIGYVDFWWPEFNLIGEFDGFGKYRRAELLGGKSPADAVIEEKIREDRLRALGPSVCRWGWSVARSLPRLERHLREAGLA